MVWFQGSDLDKKTAPKAPCGLKSNYLSLPIVHKINYSGGAILPVQTRVNSGVRQQSHMGRRIAAFSVEVAAEWVLYAWLVTKAMAKKLWGWNNANAVYVILEG